MADPKNQPSQEPSMEEILASIRRIISEDGDGKAAPAAGTAAPSEPAQGAPPPPPPPVQPVHPPPPPPPPPAAAAPPPPAPAPAEEPVLELTEMVEPPRQASEDAIASASTVAASAGMFAGLQAAARTPPASDVRLGDAGLTLEQLVRSELRGLLQAWLDANLPGVVERLVQKEIKRISRQVDEI